MESHRVKLKQNCNKLTSLFVLCRVNFSIECSQFKNCQSDPIVTEQESSTKKIVYWRYKFLLKLTSKVCGNNLDLTNRDHYSFSNVYFSILLA